MGVKAPPESCGCDLSATPGMPTRCSMRSVRSASRVYATASAHLSACSTSFSSCAAAWAAVDGAHGSESRVFASPAATPRRAVSPRSCASFSTETGGAVVSASVPFGERGVVGDRAVGRNEEKKLPCAAGAMGDTGFEKNQLIAFFLNADALL